MIVMCLKLHFNAARPSQICPAVVPMFDQPRTASYPAGHSLQSYLISYVLLRVMPEVPQSKKPEAQSIEGEELRPWAVNHGGLFALARRVADNRVVAGVHFDIDSEAGFLVARKIDEWFDVWCQPTFENNKLRALVLAASNEFPQFRNV
jgi:acid phosphatase (class A)